MDGFFSRQNQRLAGDWLKGRWLPPAGKSAEAQSMGYDAYDYSYLGHYHQRGGTETWFGNKSQLLNLC
jgi:alpha-amylase